MLFRLRRTFTSINKPILQTGKLWLSAVLPYQPMIGGRELLDAEYSRGTWDYLRSLNEMPRFSVVVGYCQYYKPEAAKILEIGCGEGLLQERLCSSQYARYLGIDISSVAIERAASRQDEKTSFVQEDASTFHPDEQFDIIAFNESLEYFEDPLGTLQRYESFLEENGVFIVSMYVGTDTVRTKRIWKALEDVYTPEAATRVSTRPGYSWIIKVYQPARTGV